MIDLDTSLRYRDAHVPGAWFATRANLAETLPKRWAELPKAKRIVLVSPDGVLARLASAEVAAMAAWKVATLEGGMKAWKEAGLPLENEHTKMADPPTDVWYRPYDRKEGVEAAMNQYLEWEIDLVGPGETRRRFALQRALDLGRHLMDRDAIIAKLKEQSAAFRALGIDALYLFGSAARSEAGPYSDIDLFCDYRPGQFDLFDLMGARDQAEAILGRRVDFLTRKGLHPALRGDIEMSAVQVF